MLDIPTFEAYRFSNLVSKWCKDSGREWTVKRLKSLQQAHKDYLLTGIYTVPDGFATRVNRKKKRIFNDPLIHSMMGKASSERRLKLQLIFFRMHEVIKLPVTSAPQFNKWIDGVNSDVHSEEVVDNICEEFEQFVRTTKLPNNGSNWSDFVPLVHQPMRYKSSPVFDDKGSVKPRPRSNLSTLTLAPLRSGPWKDIIEKFPTCTNMCLTGDGNNDGYRSTVTDLDTTSTPFGGAIGFIQEKSAKLRAVASPFLVIQAMGEPAKQQLGRLSKLLREMHTHDQELAKDLVREALSRGQEVHGYDSSAFTDRLPFKLQRVVLHKLRVDGWISEFDIASIEAVVNSVWSVANPESRTFGVDTVRWKVGQPMGYGPSFHLAALSHWYLLRFCASRVGKDYRDKFAVVGDDVSIFDSDIGNEYVRVMTDLGVEINLEKSVVSSEIGEFCKKVILPSTVIETLSVQDNLHSDDQIAAAVEFYGKKFIKFLPKAQRAMARMCLLPTNVGGLGLSPDGFNYREYLALLNTLRIANHTMSKEVSDFYGGVSRSSSLELTLQLLSERYAFLRSPAAYAITANEVLSSTLFSVDPGVIVNGLTGLPVSVVLGAVQAKQPGDEVVPARSLNFRQVFDYTLRKILSSQPETALQNCAVVLLNDLGYFRKQEKPPWRPIRTMELDNEYSDSSQDQERRSRSKSKSRGRGLQRYFRSDIADIEW